MTDERFDYVREQFAAAIENSAARIAWVIAQETGKHVDNDPSSVRRREELQLAIESFLRM